jgi:hypothetical protein
MRRTIERAIVPRLSCAYFSYFRAFSARVHPCEHSRAVARRPLSSDLSLEPISAPNASIIDMVEDAAEEMFDTVPGASRRDLEDPMRTAEMDQATLARLLPRTRPEDSHTVAMRAPRGEPQTEPSMPAAVVEEERLISEPASCSDARRAAGGRAVKGLIEHVPSRTSAVVKVVVAGLVFGAAAAALWFAT